MKVAKDLSYIILYSKERISTMAFQNNKFWKYVVKKRSFILGNQSKYIQQYFCIDETTKEITCASSTKPKDITERFAFEELSQVCNSAAAEEGCSAPSAHGFAISNGGNTIWNIFCDSATERDEWVAKLTLIQGKMQKIRQLSSGSSSSTLLARSTGNSKEKEALTDLSPRFVADDDKEGEPRASSQECRPSYSGLAPAVKTRRRSSITFNFDEIDGKRAAEADIGGSNPMKASAVKSQIIDSDAALVFVCYIDLTLCYFI